MIFTVLSSILSIHSQFRFLHAVASPVIFLRAADHEFWLRLSKLLSSLSRAGFVAVGLLVHQVRWCLQIRLQRWIVMNLSGQFRLCCQNLLPLVEQSRVVPAIVIFGCGYWGGSAWLLLFFSILGSHSAGRARIDPQRDFLQGHHTCRD